MVKKLLVWIFSLAILSSCAFATDLVSFIEPIKNEITVDEVAMLKIFTQNYQTQDDIVSIFVDDPSWTVHSAPLYHYFSGIKIESNETLETILYLKPSGSIGIGKYVIRITLTSKNTNTKITKSINVRVKPIFQERLEYGPTVDITTSIQEKIDPRYENSIKIHFKNRNALDIENLSIDIESNLVNLNRKSKLEPL